MVLAQSLFALLKERNPRSRIDVIAPAWTEPLLSRMPEVNETVLLALKHGELGMGERIRIGRALRSRNYDRAVVLPNSLKSAIVPFVARARRRTGFLGEWRFGLLNDIRRLDKSAGSRFGRRARDARRARAKDGPRHKAALPRTVDRFVSLGLEAGEPLPSDIPVPRLQVRKGKSLEVLARLGRTPPTAPVLGLCPGAEYGPAKRWPAEYFAEVAQAKLNEGWEVWLFGSERDAPITRAIQSRVQGRCLDLGGKTSLAEAIDLMSLTTTVVSNDSGLMHVAAALGCGVVALYGSSDPGHTPPMSDKAKVMYLGLSCSPCFKRECPLGHLRCLKEIAPGMVLEALSAMV